MKKFFALLLGFALLMTSQVALARNCYFGASWGFTRTIWAPNWGSDGYPQAGNGALTLSLRAKLPYKENLSIIPFVSYLTSRHTTSYRTGGYDVYIIHTEHTYFREMDVGVHLHYYLPLLDRSIYIGGGPALQFHESGRRLFTEPHQMETFDDTSPAVALACGWATKAGERLVVFFEPQFVFSPDAIDRQKASYPPDKLTLQMGILWK